MLLQAQKSLLALYEKTLETVKVLDYQQSLYDTSVKLIKALPGVYSQQDKDKIQSVLDTLTKILNRAPEQSMDLAQSHGDFQPANILIDRADKSLCLIDWEYSKKRSIYYDALVFATQCRSPLDLSERIKFLQDAGDAPWSWCVKHKKKTLSMVEWGIFLLEDLQVRLLELQIPDMIRKDDGLDTWLKEIEKMEWLTRE